jgi:hypothetical protein
MGLLNAMRHLANSGTLGSDAVMVAITNFPPSATAYGSRLRPTDPSARPCALLIWVDRDLRSPPPPSSSNIEPAYLEV